MKFPNEVLTGIHTNVEMRTTPRQRQVGRSWIWKVEVRKDAWVGFTHATPGLRRPGTLRIYLVLLLIWPPWASVSISSYQRLH